MCVYVCLCVCLYVSKRESLLYLRQVLFDVLRICEPRLRTSKSPQVSFLVGLF